ncbi:MAG: efflux RND transporter periplasmic adaptor subunit [Alphaproteobacteria bacterium]|nr:efflux RND transporter periplasmic adaptor subunit [Alphaproteobacteria bacterium]
MKSSVFAALLSSLLAGTAMVNITHAETAAAKTDAGNPVVTVLEAKTKAIASNLTVTGSFAAGELVLVSPQIEGLAITEILAEEGDVVKKGQVLAKLSSDAVDIKILQTKAAIIRGDANIKQAENQIEQAQINNDRAQADLNRTKKLRSSGVSTVEQFDQRQAAADLTTAQLQAANLSLDLAKADRLSLDAQMKDLLLQKSRTEIVAPVDGYISRRTAQVGGIASASRDPMFNIVANSTLKLLAEVAESDLPKVKVGQKASIVVNGLKKPIDGEVKLVSREVNETTRIGIAHIRIAEGTQVPLGSFGRATIALAASEGVVLPLTAVTFGEDGPTVQVVENNKVKVRKVITGLVSTSEIEITDGLKPGESVVARAGTFVRDGDTVTAVKMTDASQ